MQEQRNARPKVAAVVTVYRKYSHAQHIVDRFLDGYGWNGTYHHPPMDLVSLYVDQVGPDDLSRERAQRFPGMKIYPNIHDALTQGTGKLAVDAGSSGCHRCLPSGSTATDLSSSDLSWRQYFSSVPGLSFRLACSQQRVGIHAAAEP